MKGLIQRHEPSEPFPGTRTGRINRLPGTLPAENGAELPERPVDFPPLKQVPVRRSIHHCAGIFHNPTVSAAGFSCRRFPAGRCGGYRFLRFPAAFCF